MRQYLAVISFAFTGRADQPQRRSRPWKSRRLKPTGDAFLTRPNSTCPCAGTPMNCWLKRARSLKTSSERVPVAGCNLPSFLLGNEVESRHRNGRVLSAIAGCAVKTKRMRLLFMTRTKCIAAAVVAPWNVFDDGPPPTELPLLHERCRL